MHRHICLGLALTLLVACSDDPAGPGRDPDPDPDPQPTATPVLVSGPVAPAAAGADVRSVRGDGSRVFVSMPPGTEPGASAVTVGVKTSTASVRAPVVDGGFDPVAVEALAGDSLIIVVTRPGGSEVSYAKVPAASKPVVVRTSPRHRRVDVPLNPVIVIVFNQPMTFGSLTPAIRLWRAGIEVAGTLTPVVTDGHVLGAQLVPDELLAAATTYTLEVTTAALDFDGTPLEAPLQAEFTTGSDVADATIAVSTTTTGTDIDPDGYEVVIDGKAPQPIDVSGTLSVSVAAGTHSVTLGGLSASCAVARGATRSVAAFTGSTADVAFEIVCGPVGDGTLVVTTTTTGSDPDPDGYSVIIDGGPPQPIATNGSIEAVLPASVMHTVELVGISGNCSPARRIEGDVQLTPGAPTTVPFDVECTEDFRPSGTIAFTTQSGSTWSIFTSQADGSGRVRVATGTGEIGQLAWSPDGQRLAFSIATAEGRDIFVMNADGSNLVQRTDTGENDSPSWSPDGHRIAFGSLRENRSTWGVHVMNVDGDWSDVTLVGPLLRQDPRPAWSPDGTSIAFVDLTVIERLEETGVFVMRADGTGVVQLPYLSFRAADRATWSPDGSALAVASWVGWGLDIDMMIAQVDGSGARGLLLFDVYSPSWSPDGSTIAFESCGQPNPCVVYATPFGQRSSVRVLDARGAAWRP